jgi:hypothetical protein
LTYWRRAAFGAGRYVRSKKPAYEPPIALALT